jgi:hypothetical protein
MRFRRIFPALDLSPSHTEQTHARRAGMAGLRHKPRHKISWARLSSPIVQGYSGPPPHVHVLGRVDRKKFEKLAKRGQQGSDDPLSNAHLTVPENEHARRDKLQPYCLLLRS